MMPLDELMRTEDEGGASAPIGIKLRMEARAALPPDAHEGHPYIWEHPPLHWP